MTMTEIASDHLNPKWETPTVSYSKNLYSQPTTLGQVLSWFKQIQRPMIAYHKS